MKLFLVSMPDYAEPHPFIFVVAVLPHQDETKVREIVCDEVFCGFTEDMADHDVRIIELAPTEIGVVKPPELGPSFVNYFFNNR